MRAAPPPPLISTHQLSEQQLQDLHVLSLLCQTQDGNGIPLYAHLLGSYRPYPANLLLYEGTQLLGFLAVFFFYAKACEVVLLITPTRRRQGLARHLLQAAFPLIQAQRCRRLIFSMPHRQVTACEAMLPFIYEGTEYLLQQPISYRTPDCTKKLIIRPATREDTAALCAIDNACFPTAAGAMPDRFARVLHDPQYVVCMAWYDNIPVGKAHYRLASTTKVILSDIAVIPAFQNQGFGSALIVHCTNAAYQSQHAVVELSVEAMNKSALQWYLRLGFTLHNAWDYWSIATDSIQTNGFVGVFT